ncbi:MAG TPA: hypothetical protein VHE37_05045 [Nevskiaceae bacterium]|nr:hypothetical protein [Nevskiaceae bacterium]
MSEKLLELSSVVNVLSRTVGDLEKQRQSNETRSLVMSALMMALINTLPEERRAEVAKNFSSAADALMQASTSAGRAALQKEIASIHKMLA